MTNHHHITGALADARAADMRRTAARNTPTATAGPRFRRHALAAVLMTIGALSVSTGALARPSHDVGSSTHEHSATARQHHPRATPGAITFTNPLDRSRGPGAGAGLL